MRVSCLLPTSIVLSISLLAVTKVRKMHLEKLEKQIKFAQLKFRVTEDVLAEYERQTVTATKSLEEKHIQLKSQEDENKSLSGSLEVLVTREQDCYGQKQSLADYLEETEQQATDRKVQYEEEKKAWEGEKADLKRQFTERSPVCDYLKAGSELASALCGKKVGEEPKKAEAPKPEEPKAEAPKPEEPKAEAPKPEEPKAEAPKPEEPKVEPPKPEERMVEPPKPEEPKQVL